MAHCAGLFSAATCAFGNAMDNGTFMRFSVSPLQTLGLLNLNQKLSTLKKYFFRDRSGWLLSLPLDFARDGVVSLSNPSKGGTKDLPTDFTDFHRFGRRSWGLVSPYHKTLPYTIPGLQTRVRTGRLTP